MLEEMEKHLKALIEKGVSADYQLYNEDTETPLIVTIITPLMKRVHSMVIYEMLSLIKNEFGHLYGLIGSNYLLFRLIFRTK